MSPRQKTVFRREANETTVWTAVVMLTSLTAAFGVFSLLLTSQHSLADGLMSSLPGPGAATSLAADDSLAGQMHLSDSTVSWRQLRDGADILVASTTVTNDALIPVENVVLEAQALGEDGAVQDTVFTTCGKTVSEQMLGRMKVGDVQTLMRLRASSEPALGPTDRARCQVVFEKPRSGPVAEVTLRVTSVEPVPGHPPRRFALSE